MLGILYGWSGEAARERAPFDGHFAMGSRLLEALPLPSELPAWLTEADVDVYTQEFAAAGFRGGLNWYRNIDALPGFLAPFVGRTIEQPALYMYGEHDLVAGNAPETIARLPSMLPNLTKVVKMPGAGHWLQQERAEDVNRELIAFLGSLQA